MYSENKKITLRQLKRLIVFDLFGIISMIVPYVITSNTGYDGIPALIIGAILIVVYVLILLFFMKNIDGDYMEFSDKAIGSVLTFVVSILYIIKFFVTAVLLTRIFTEVIKQTILIEYSAISIVVPMIIFAGYLAIKGIEVRARFSEALYFIILVPIFLLLLLGLKEVDIANLMPVFRTGAIHELNGGYHYFLIFSLLELLLFVKPYVLQGRKKRSIYTSILSYTLQAVLIIFVFSLLYFILTVGIVGESAASSSIWSSVMIMQLIKVPWTLLNRQDSMIIGLWMISIFSILGAMLYYMCYLAKRMFRISNKSCIMPLIVLFVIIASVVPMNLDEFYEYYLRYITWIGLPQTFIIPLIIVLAGKARKVGKNEPSKPTKMKKEMAKTAKHLSVLLLFLFLSFMMVSCSNHVEIEDREFVQALGIDYVDNEFKAYYILPDLGAISEQGSTDSEKLLRSISGSDFYDIEEEYKLCSAKKLDYSHLKAVIIGSGLSSNEGALDEFTNYAESNYEISKNTYIFLVKESVKTIVDYNENVENGIGDYLDRLYKNNLVDSEKEEITLGSLINANNNSDLAIQVPLLTIINQSLAIDGVGIIKNDTLQYEMEGEDAIYSDILSGFGENSRIFTSLNGDENATFVIRLTDLYHMKKIEVQNGKPLYKLYIQATGTVEKGLEQYSNASTKEKKEVYKQLKTIVDNQIEEKLKEQFNKIEKSYGIDYLNIYRLSRYKNVNLYEFYKGNQSGFVNDLLFNVDVDVRFY